jgi:hypothetical protein
MSDFVEKPLAFFNNNMNQQIPASSSSSSSSSPSSWENVQNRAAKREMWLDEFINKGHPASSWKTLPENMVYFWHAEDVFCPELPSQKHVKVSKLHFKGRGKDKEEAAVLEVGKAAVIALGKFEMVQVYIPYEIQVSIFSLRFVNRICEFFYHLIYSLFFYSCSLICFIQAFPNSRKALVFCYQ